MDNRNAKTQYGQPKGRVFEQAADFKNVVVIGEDASGQRHILSSLSNNETAGWLEQSQLQPTG